MENRDVGFSWESEVCCCFGSVRFNDGGAVVSFVSAFGVDDGRHMIYPCNVYYFL